MVKKILLYALVLSLPVVLGASVGQAVRYTQLAQEVQRLNHTQEDWISINRRLITEIAGLSSPERIEKVAKDDLGLHPVPPEDIMQIRVQSMYKSGK
jgi:cell division protein FtsL